MSDEDNPIDVTALVALGAERLATLLAEAAMTNPCMRRRLQFELSAQKNENMPEVIRRWISELREQTTFLDAEEIDELARDSTTCGPPLSRMSPGRYRSLRRI